MTTKLVIFGAGGFGREVLQVVLDLNNQSVSPIWDVRGFLVDVDHAKDNFLQGYPVLGDMHWLSKHPDTQVLVAIGDSAARQEVVARIRAVSSNVFASLVHPRAWVGRNVVVGVGTVICAGCQITTDIQVGSHVHINIGSTIGHDAILGDFVSLNPGVHLSGNVVLQEGVEVGTGGVLIPGVQVGAWSTIGAGAVVLQNLPSKVTAVGVPARVIKNNNVNIPGDAV